MLTEIYFWAEWVAVVIAGILAIIGFYFKVLVPLKLFFRKYFAKIEKILHEVTPNGGESLKDCINRIEETTNLIYQKNKLMSDYLPIGIWEFDQYGGCVWINQSIKDLTGYDNDDYFIGNNWISLITEEDRIRVATEWARSVKQMRQFKMKFKMECHDKKIITVFVKNTAIVDKNNKIKGYLGSIVPAYQIE